MGLRSTKGYEKRLGPATTLYETVALSFVIPSAAEGSAVPQNSLGNAEPCTQTELSSRLPRRAVGPERSAVERSAFFSLIRSPPSENGVLHRTAAHIIRPQNHFKVGKRTIRASYTLQER
jgi:hypothetical protein